MYHFVHTHHNKIVPNNLQVSLHFNKYFFVILTHFALSVEFHVSLIH